MKGRLQRFDDGDSPTREKSVLRANFAWHLAVDKEEGPVHQARVNGPGLSRGDPETELASDWWLRAKVLAQPPPHGRPIPGDEQRPKVGRFQGGFGRSALRFCLLAALAFGACKNAEPETKADASQASRMARFQDEVLGLELRLSDRWTVLVAADQAESTILDARYAAGTDGALVRPRLLVSKRAVPADSKSDLATLLDRSIERTKASLSSTQVRIRRVSTKSWQVDGVDVSSFDLSYIISNPVSEREVEVTQKSLLALRRSLGEAVNPGLFLLEINATYVENAGTTLGSEIETVFRSLKFTQDEKHDDP